MESISIEIIKFNCSTSKYLRLFSATYLIFSKDKTKTSGDFVFLMEVFTKI